MDIQSELPHVVYWQMQGSDRLCGVHTLNALLQGPYFNEVELAQIGRELDKKEKQIFMSQTGMSAKQYSKHVKNGSNNVSVDGNYGIQVLEAALFQFGGFKVENIRKKQIRQSIKDWCEQTAFICNSVAHWFTIRKVYGVWYNLNSANQGIGPEIITPFYMDAFITSVQEQGYNIFVIRDGQFPLPDPKKNQPKAPNHFYLSMIQIEEESKKNPSKTPNIYGTDQRDLKRALEASLNDIGGKDNIQNFHGPENVNYGAMVKENNQKQGMMTQEEEIAYAIQMSMNEQKGSQQQEKEEQIQQIDQDLAAAMQLSMKENQQKQEDEVNENKNEEQQQGDKEANN